MQAIKPPRITSIDYFRGFAILLMVLANYLAGVTWIPTWLKHAPDIGLTVIDLIAPFFIFAIGLTYGLSISRRSQTDGWPKTIGRIIKRYLILIAIGLVLSAGEIWLGHNVSGIYWGVLQAIGAAGLLTLPVIRFPTWARFIVGFSLLAGYQVLLEQGWRTTVLAAPHGGLLGALSWTAMLMLATALADIFHRSSRGTAWLLSASILFAVFGLVVSIWFPISKNQVSPTYVLVSLGVSGILFSAFSFLFDHKGLRLPVLTDWGKNPIILYVLHLLLLGLMVLPGIPSWYAEAPTWLVVLQAVFLIVSLTLIARWLNSKNLIISL